MASEIVSNNEADETKHGPTAFAGYDSIMFSAWAAAVADLLLCCNSSSTDDATVRSAGGLIFSLIQASHELSAADNGMRSALA